MRKPKARSPQTRDVLSVGNELTSTASLGIGRYGDRGELKHRPVELQLYEQSPMVPERFG